MTLIRDAQEEGRRMFLEEPTLNKIGAAGDLLRQLSPYYDPKANTNPPLEPEERSRMERIGDHLQPPPCALR